VGWPRKATKWVMNGKEFGTKTSWPIPGIIRAFFCRVTEESYEIFSEERWWPCWCSRQPSDRFPYTDPFLLQARRSTSRTFGCGSIRQDPKALLSTSEPARTARGFPISSTGEICRQVALLLSVFRRGSAQTEGLQFQNLPAWLHPRILFSNEAPVPARLLFILGQNKNRSFYSLRRPALV